MQKYQIFDLQEHRKRFRNILPVFGFNYAKYDLNIVKTFLLPILINERDIRPTVNKKKTNQFTSFKFGDFQFLDIMNFLGRATSLVSSFLEAYKTSQTKRYFPYE